MFCEKCGTNVPEGTNCPKCGHTQGNVILTGNGGKAEKDWLQMLIKYHKFIIAALTLAMISGTAIIRDPIYWNFFHFNTYYLARFANILGFAVCIVVIAFAFKSKSRIDYQCPKCGKITHHNKHNICTECNFDCESNIYLSLLYFLVSFIYPNFFVILVLFVFVLLTPIYMYPAKLARRTEHSAATAIFWLNIFLGGTLIMWIVLLIWGSSGKGNAKTVVIQQAPTQPTVGNSFEELQKLKDMGMISAEEFDEKRKELLKRI